MNSGRRMDLRRAIIKGDFNRLERGEHPINSIRNLAIELSMANPDKYILESLLDWLLRAYRGNFGNGDGTYEIDDVGKDISELLHLNNDEFIMNC